MLFFADWCFDLWLNSKPPENLVAQNNDLFFLLILWVAGQFLSWSQAGSWLLPAGVAAGLDDPDSLPAGLGRGRCLSVGSLGSPGGRSPSGPLDSWQSPGQHPREGKAGAQGLLRPTWVPESPQPLPVHCQQGARPAQAPGGLTVGDSGGNVLLQRNLQPLHDLSWWQACQGHLTAARVCVGLCGSRRPCSACLGLFLRMGLGWILGLSLAEWNLSAELDRMERFAQFFFRPWPPLSATSCFCGSPPSHTPES